MRSTDRRQDRRREGATPGRSSSPIPEQARARGRSFARDAQLLALIEKRPVARTERDHRNPTTFPLQRALREHTERTLALQEDGPNLDARTREGNEQNG